MSYRSKLRLIGVLAVVLAVFGGIAAALQQVRLSSRRTGSTIPTARVKRGNLELKVYTTGELRPARTAQLIAPPVGGTLQIVSLARTGSLVKAGDTVVEFDPSEQEYNLDQNRSELLQAEQEITKMKADAAVQLAQDKVSLLRAKFDVRRAELEVSRNELVSAIDAKKNLLSLEEAKRRLEQLEKDIRSREVSQQASLAVLEERRNRARLQMLQAQQNIENMRLRTPISGLVAVKENRDATGGIFITGMVLPDFREGDMTSPGRLIAEVLEVSQMEILARVAESDRANVNPGQPVEVRVDAMPEQSYSGKVKTVGGLASRGPMWRTDAARKFDATFLIDEPDEKLRPGVTAQVIVVGDEVRDALYLPRQAIFEKEGKPVVYVKSGDSFEAHEAKIKHRTESQVVVEGLAEGTEVALVDPERRTKRVERAAGPITPPAAGGPR